MQAERFARIRTLYEDVIDLDAQARAEFLSRQNIPADIVDEVLALCRASDDSDTELLNRPRDALLGEATAAQPVAGDVFGAWRVVAEIGHGGMGRVFRVERNDGHYTQTAALKFIKGVAAESAITLFTRERQVLARLQHPRIARLIDGGATAQGRPYLVMDYIDGLPIDVWCAKRRPDRNALLGLFVAACAAVSHAHRQLVVHCDLKPSNILVTPAGEPVLLDFGIAQLADRISDTPLADATAPSSAGYTPRYASPEQRRGERVSTASDVYSLGVVLGEMTEQAGLRKDRELAALIARATHAQVALRYASVDALCEDIARLHAHQPLHALPPTVRYRLGKLMRRRWVAMLSAAGVLALCVGFTAQLISERQRALAAEQVALAERDRSRQAEVEARASEATAHETTEFLISIFSGANPDAGSGTVSIATLLDQALLRVERDLAREPATQSQMLAALARALFVIGQPERARTLYAQAIAIERQQQRPLVLAGMLIGNAGQVLRNQPGRVPHDDVREALQLIDAHATPGSRQMFDLVRAAASILGDDHPAEATPLFEQALQMARALSPDSLELAEVLATFGWHERRASRFDRAIPMMEESLALRRRFLDENHEEYIGPLEVLANTLGMARRFDEAEPLFRQALDLHRRSGGLDSARGAWSLAQYATMLSNAGRPLDALPLYDEIFAIAGRKLSADDGARVVWSHNLASTALAAGDRARAIALVRPAVATVRERWGATARGTARMLLTQGRAVGQDDCVAEAGEAFAQAVTAFSPQGEQGDPDFDEARIDRARWLVSCGEFAQAQDLLDAVAARTAPLPAVPAQLLAEAVGVLHLRRDGNDSALRRAETLAGTTYAVGDPRAVLVKLPRLRWLAAHQQHAEAATLAQTMLRDVEPALVAHAPVLDELRSVAATHRGP